MRERYRGEFKQAFEAAMATLSARELALLRYRFVDNASVADIAKVYNVHRATPSRWLTDIRAKLRDETCRRLVELLGGEYADAQSLLRALGSGLDASISAFLRPGD